MSDLVERLRGWPRKADCKEAADEIERLTMAVKISDTIIKELMVDNERLRVALQQIAHDQTDIGYAQHLARAALEGEAVSDALCECHLPPVCECCLREVDKVRGSLWGHRSTCSECFIQWYDPDSGVDGLDPISIGNHIRKKHGLPPRAALEGGK